ncbi:hypothetical protein TSMEX_002586 [Taenia solium]|eukprot:TsM_000911200 transcript=TsM_000911200 gene=TsM_000911200
MANAVPKHERRLACNGLPTSQLVDGIRKEEYNHSFPRETIHCCIVSSSQVAGGATTRHSAHNCLTGRPGAQLPARFTVRDIHTSTHHSASIDNLTKSQWSSTNLTDSKATALHAAARQGLMEMIKWSVGEENANLLEVTTAGQMAFDFAIQSKHRGVIRYLLPRVVNRQLQPIDGGVGTPRIRRTRSVSLTDARVPQSQTEDLARLSDPLRRRSAHFHQLPKSGEHPIYLDVCEPDEDLNIVDVFIEATVSLNDDQRKI